jgi:hypothetical protein
MNLQTMQILKGWMDPVPFWLPGAGVFLFVLLQFSVAGIYLRLEIGGTAMNRLIPHNFPVVKATICERMRRQAV